jgi:hypothetical protein
MHITPDQLAVLKALQADLIKETTRPTIRISTLRDGLKIMGAILGKIKDKP